jgi:SAM-dependent methyltransferase
MARRFGCNVNGIDITRPFVDTANKLTALVRMQDSVSIEHGDGQRLPYGDVTFDGAYSQHVTMNVADRRSFFSEAHRVLKRGAFFALTEHGLGPKGDPWFPLPWSTDGTGSYLHTSSETIALLESVGFGAIVVEDKGKDYEAAYRATLAKAEKEGPPPLGLHLLLGATAAEKTRNALRNIEEGRTHPFQLVCVKR